MSPDAIAYAAQQAQDAAFQHEGDVYMACMGVLAALGLVGLAVVLVYPLLEGLWKKKDSNE